MQFLNLSQSLNSENSENEQYKEIKRIHDEISKQSIDLKKTDEEFKEQMKKEKPQIFEEIEKYNNHYPNIEFIKLIIEKYPYKGYNPNENILTEYQENSYQDQPYEVFPRQEQVVVTRWYTKNDVLIS